MQHVIDKIMSEPVMVALLAVAFSLSIIGFLARIRRDDRSRREKQLDSR